MIPNHTTKKIIICFGNLGIGGIQTKIVSLSEYLLRTRGDMIQIHLVLRDTPGFNLERQLHIPNVTIHHRPQFRFGFIHFPFTFYYPWKVVTIQPDVILSFFDYLSSLSVISSRLLFWKKIRVVLNEDILSSAVSRSMFHKFLICTFYPLADHVIVPTRAVQQDLITRFGIPETKTIVVPNWTLASPGVQSSYKPFDLLYVGRFEKQKNLLFLLRAVRLLIVRRPALKLGLVGEGSQLQKIQDYIRRYHVSRNVIVRDSNPNISRYLDQTKIFVLSSHFEGMPVALLEAMAHNCPTITTRFPGVAEFLIHGKTGFITDSLHEFAQRIQFLLAHPVRRRRMGLTAHALVRTQFSKIPLRNFVRVLINENYE